MVLQTVIINKSKAKSKSIAEQIAKKYADRIYTSRETESTWRFRQFPPEDAIGPYVTKTISPGIFLVFAKGKK